MKLSEILYQIKLNATVGDMAIELNSLVIDSRKAEVGSLFIAIIGTETDGHDYIQTAIERGASAVLCQTLPSTLLPQVSYALTPDTSKAAGLAASNFYHNPSHRLKVVSVTGTNGKTTIATLLYMLFGGLGYRAGLISTVTNYIDGQKSPSTHTTPDAINLQKLLAQMVKAGCTHCFMEASSHAIHQQRIAGVRMEGAIFSNISHDHLDYHQTFDHYIKAKKKLFDELSHTAFALTNLDDKHGRVMLQNCLAMQKTYSIQAPASFRVRMLSNTLQGLQLEIDGTQAWFQLIGAFNASNLLAVYGAAVLLGQDKNEVLQVLSGLQGVTGRFQRIVSPSGITAIVDYAHTPDALENVLTTLAELKSTGSKIITVVGCGGNRDATKRPLMAAIAAKYSQKSIFTSDNPRNEDPQEIVDQMLKGISQSQKINTQTVLDRKEAIRQAWTLASTGDIILIAGKGHENYQQIKQEKVFFDDAKIISDFFFS